MEYTMNTPRVSQLPFLITVNINIAFANNATLIGFDRALICMDDSISIFNQSGPSPASSTRPQTLEPTPMQSNVVHHPWFDVFPFPKFRDNIIQAVATGVLDDDDLCANIAEINYANTEKPSLIVWGESSNPQCWEASVLFLRKWGWLLEGCPEILETTNKWRQSRGEKLLYWYD